MAKKRKTRIRKMRVPLLGITLVALVLLVFVLSLSSYIWGFISEHNSVILVISSVAVGLFLLIGILKPKKLKKAMKGAF